MTKYVLNSGGLRKYPEKAKAFFNELIKGLGTSPRILVCFFALPRQDWERKFPEYSENYKAMAPKGVTPKVALALPDIFAEQIRGSDVIILQGGDDHLLQYWLRKFDLVSLWKGKVVAGSSAGADALSKYFWTCDWRMCMSGLGIVPVKFIPHYRSDYGADDPSRGPIDWDKAYKELKSYKDDLPIHALEEGEYMVFESDH